MRTIWQRSARVGLATAVAVFGVAVAGCETEAGEMEVDDTEVGEVPEVVEMEAEPGEAGLDLDEALPLTAEDVGERLLVTGTVVGTILPGGFFVATEGGTVLYVATDHVAVPGELVSVTGILESTTATVFDEWETDALEGEIEAEWDVVPLYYLNAESVASPQT